MLETVNRIYSLKQASDVTGFSLGKFRYHKDALMNAGATITTEGYRIPHQTLQQLGWLGVKAPKTVVAPPSLLEQAELHIKELETEVLFLRKQGSRKHSLFGRKKK